MTTPTITAEAYAQAIDEAAVACKDWDTAQRTAQWVKRRANELTAARASEGQCEARNAPDVMAWRPIETAPRDGTCFLATDAASGYDPAFSVVFYYDGNFECTDDGTERPHLTHWMPIPALPFAADQSKEQQT